MKVDCLNCGGETRYQESNNSRNNPLAQRPCGLEYLEEKRCKSGINERRGFLMFKPLEGWSKLGSQPADIQCKQQQGSNHEVGSRWRTYTVIAIKITTKTWKRNDRHIYSQSHINKDGHYPILGRSGGLAWRASRAGCGEVCIL